MSDKVESIELYEFSHFLKDTLTMPDSALAIVSDEDLDDYELEYGTFRTERTNAQRKRDELFLDINKRLEVLFSFDGKEQRYFSRCQHNGEDVVTLHSNKIPSVNEVRSKVNQARQKVDVSTLGKGGCVGEDSLEEINNATSWLLSKEFELGTDFTVGNAISIAKAEFIKEMADEIHNSFKDSESNDEFINFDGRKVYPTQISDLYKGCMNLENGDSYSDYDLHKVEISFDNPSKPSYKVEMYDE